MLLFYKLCFDFTNPPNLYSILWFQLIICWLNIRNFYLFDHLFYKFRQKSHCYVNNSKVIISRAVSGMSVGLSDGRNRYSNVTDQRNAHRPWSQLIVLIWGSELSGLSLERERRVMDHNKGFSLTYLRSECRHVYDWRLMLESLVMEGKLFLCKKNQQFKLLHRTLTWRTGSVNCAINVAISMFVHYDKGYNLQVRDLTTLSRLAGKDLRKIEIWLF